MEKVIERFLAQCKQLHKLNEISGILSDFQAECRKLLEREIRNIGLSRAQEGAVKLLCQCWSFPIKWELIAKPFSIEISEGLAKIGEVNYSIVVRESKEEIARLINDAITQIRIIALDGNLLVSPPIEVLRWAQNYFDKICRSSSNTEIEKIFSELLDDNFGAQFVFLNSEFTTSNYFNFIESNSIENPKTTLPAIILKRNNECILRGTYLLPIQKS